MKNLKRIGEIKKNNSSYSKIIEAYISLGKTHTALNLEKCSNVISHMYCEQHHNQQKVRIQYCKNRYCPICTVHRSHVFGMELKQVVNKIRENNPEGHWIFLTLTVKNVESTDLNDTLKKMMQSWQRLSQRNVFRNAVQGWFRGLEITYNRYEQTFHPHFHVLVYTKPSYFSGKYYISQKCWQNMWRDSLRSAYLPIVDVRKVRAQNGDFSKALLEVSKYPMKLSDISSILEDGFFKDFEHALFKRRLTAFGGILKKEISMLRNEQLPTSDEKECSVCGMSLVEHSYVWSNENSLFQSYS